MERVAALKKKHLMEAQEEMLRRENEQLKLETELAVTNAKLQVLELNLSHCGSKFRWRKLLFREKQRNE